MPPDATATKKRILEAALAEFAEYGIAGARVDRIAEAAAANKRSIYVHFGNKEELFDLIVERALAELADAVPFTPEDLPGYAGALFDYFLANQQLLRLAAWRQLERPGVIESEVAAYRPKVEALGAVRPEPVDLLALVLGLAGAWFGASPALRSLASEGPWSKERLAAHRAMLVAAVSALTRR